MTVGRSTDASQCASDFTAQSSGLREVCAEQQVLMLVLSGG